MAKRVSKKAKDNTPLPFEKQIWEAACVLWGHIPAADYRKVIIGLIFLRYVSSRFEARYQQLVEEGYGFEYDRDFYSEENIFWVPQEARWATIAAAAHSPEIGMTIDNAMRAIERENDTLKDVLPKDYAKPELDKRVLGEVVDLFTNLDMGSAQESTDLLGRTYEYCIENFAAYEGVKGGEFYTPASVVKTLVAILKPFENCRVYDPCCGSGGMFVQSARFIEEHSGRRDAISVYGQESNSDTWKMAKINMAIRGISADFGKHHADTFHNDLHKTLKADFILANPPFNLSGWGQEKLQDDMRWKYGTPPAGNANFAWIQHMIHHLAPNGKIGLVLANGAVFSQQSGEGDIRRNIIEADLVEGIVALPTQRFYSVTIPVTLWFISKDKKQKGKTLFIDARKMGSMIDRKHRDFSEEDIARLADTFTAFQNGTLEDVKGFCAVATTEDIGKQDYILTPGRYVGIEEQEEDSESFDEKMKRLTSELSSLFSRSHELEEQIKNNLKELGYAAIVPESDNAIFLHNQRIGLIENISDNIDKEFLYWIMRTHHYQKYIVNHASGSTVKHTSPSSIASYSFHAPSLPIQRKIASILSALDDKIETNNAICRNPEEQMESLFEKLFVREMNSEWKKGTISDLGKVIGGGTPSKKEPSYYTNNGIAWITPKDLSRCASKFVRKGEIDITRKGLEASSTTIMPEGTILFSSRAPIGYIAIAGGDVSTNQGFKSVVPYGCIGTPYVYYFLKHSTPVIENLASGSTFPEISASAMKQLPVVIPDAATLDKFNAFCEPRLNIQREKEGEISRLMELRDVLLPKLMNGEFNL